MGPYTAAHAAPRGAGDERPTALQIIDDESLSGKLVGKVIVLTGASSGIGVETARALAVTGATLILPVRDMRKARTVLGDLLSSGHVSLVDMDNSSFASIRKAASEILSVSKNQVNVLINNAGVMGIRDVQLTADGHEMHFATNYLSNFLLFHLLRPALLSSATPDFCSRLVNVSSSGHRASTLPSSDNYNFQKGDYHFHKGYENSKLAQIYMTNFVDRRYGPRGLHATSLHPGFINTEMSRNLDPEFVHQIMSDEELLKQFKDVQQGAATTVLAAVGKEWEGKGGKYLEDCEEAKQGIDDGEVFTKGYGQQTYNVSEENRLWKDSLEIIGVSDED